MLYSILQEKGADDVKKLLFESNRGISFFEETKGNMCCVKVQAPGAKRAFTHIRYCFPKVDIDLHSPLLSWENLNCCGGWAYDETYLKSAVQDGKKLYAGLSCYLDGLMTGDPQ